MVCLKSAIVDEEARVDLSAVGIWYPMQRTFMDIRVTNLLSESYLKMPIDKVLLKQEEEKKRAYLERVRDLEASTFTPLVFSANGGMAAECAMWMKRVIINYAKRNGMGIPDATRLVRSRVAFALVRANTLCLRGTKIAPYKPD